MNTIREFFANLRKSTKITLISCVSFVLMTFLILCFFIISPITPDDKAGSTYGRETVSGSVISTDVTTIAGEGLEVSKGTSKAATTTRVTTSHVDYVITITTGAGFYTGGRINTGDYDGGYDYNQNGNYNAAEEQGGIGYYDPNSNGNSSGNNAGNGESQNSGETGYNNNGGESGNSNNGGGNVSGNGGESGYNNNSGESGNSNNGGGNASGNGGTASGTANGGETGNNNNGGETDNGNSGGGNATPEQPVQTPEQPVQNPVEGGGEAAGTDE